MTHVLLVPGALIFEEDWAQIGPQGIPDRCGRRLSHARCTTQQFKARWCDGAAHLGWLAREFRVPGDPPPAAPFAWQAQTGEPPPEPPGRTLWFCEPVHLSLQPERSVLAPIDAPALTDPEADELFTEAADSARAHGLELRRAGRRWYLLPDRPWEVRTSALQACVGASIEARLPQGADALLWRRLLNEIQMRWHASPANRTREALGQQTANGLWLHGGGAWHGLTASRFARVESDDPVVLGWQQAARGQADEASAARGTDTLTVWPELFEPYWRRDWSAWSEAWARLDLRVESMLRTGRSHTVGRVEMVACGRRTAATFALQTGRSWRLWPRRSLQECLLEPEA